MSDYLRATWDFVVRHKRKFIALAVVGAVGTAGAYYAKKTMFNFLEQQMKEAVKGLEEMKENQTRETELNKLRAECSDMVIEFLPPLRKELNRLTDPKAVTLKLKDLRKRISQSGRAPTEAEEAEMHRLWEELKVLSITRLIASIYALALLDLLLRVQSHVVTRNYVDEMSELRKARSAALRERAVERQRASPAPQDVEAATAAMEADEEGLPPLRPERITEDLREKYMFTSTHHLQFQGLSKLVERVREGCRRATKDWHMGTDAQVSRQEIIDMVNRIREETEGTDDEDHEEVVHAEGDAAEDADCKRPLSRSAHEWFLSCIVQPDEALARARVEARLSPQATDAFKAMLEESMDFLESPYFAGVLEVRAICFLLFSSLWLGLTTQSAPTCENRTRCRACSPCFWTTCTHESLTPRPRRPRDRSRRPPRTLWRLAQDTKSLCWPR